MQTREAGGRGGHRTRAKRVCLYYVYLLTLMQGEKRSCARQRMELCKES